MMQQEVHGSVEVPESDVVQSCRRVSVQFFRVLYFLYDALQIKKLAYDVTLLTMLSFVRFHKMCDFCCSCQVSDRVQMYCGCLKLSMSKCFSKKIFEGDLCYLLLFSSFLLVCCGAVAFTLSRWLGGSNYLSTKLILQDVLFSCSQLSMTLVCYYSVAVQNFLTTMHRIVYEKRRNHSIKSSFLWSMLV